MASEANYKAYVELMKLFPKETVEKIMSFDIDMVLRRPQILRFELPPQDYDKLLTVCNLMNIAYKAGKLWWKDASSPEAAIEAYRYLIENGDRELSIGASDYLLLDDNLKTMFNVSATHSVSMPSLRYKILRETTLPLYLETHRLHSKYVILFITIKGKCMFTAAEKDLVKDLRHSFLYRGIYLLDLILVSLDRHEYASLFEDSPELFIDNDLPANVIQFPMKGGD